MPEISIVVPVYKVEQYLEQCVNSILKQTYKNYLLVLVDDGSPDMCGDICDELAKKHDNIRVIHQENRGLSEARNSGIEWTVKHSDCKWITFIDSDDWVHPQYLEILYKSVIDDNVRISMCDGLSTREREVDIENVEGVVWKKWASCIAYEKRYGTCMMAWGKLFDIVLFNDFRFPVGKLHEDAFTIYRLIFEVGNVSIVDTPLYFYFFNREGIMHSKWSPQRLDEIEAHEEQLKFLSTNNYNDAYKREINAYIHVLACQLKEINLNSDYKSYRKELLLKLRNAIKIHRRYCTKKIKGYEWIYELAFPKYMRLYWLRIAILRRIHAK